MPNSLVLLYHDMVAIETKAIVSYHVNMIR